MKKLTRSTLLLILLALIPFHLGSDCGGGTPVENPKKLLYVLDTTNDAVYVLAGIDTIDGAVDPERTITGENTRIVNPTAIVVDGRRDILYVADANEQLIFVYAPASTQDGDVSPTRTLPAGGNIRAMVLDEPDNRLFVFNATDLSIQVWDSVSSVNETPPDRTFFIGFLASSIYYDAVRDLLYIGDPIAMNIKLFAQASTLIGSPLPVRTISDDERPFDRIDGLTMNQDNDILFAANGLTPSIDIFLDASTRNGETDPDRFIEGENAQLSDELGFLKFLEDVLYVSNRPTEIAIWNNANNIDGDLAPDRLITVNPAARIIGFDIDLLH